MPHRKFPRYVVFLISFLIIGTLTFFSFLTAFAYDEGTINKTIGMIGYYSFYIFRFQTHNIIWMKPQWIDALFFPGLICNVFLYSIVVTFIISVLKKKSVITKQ